MYTTIIHPIRKAHHLSVNEYVVLDTIYQLSNNQKFGGWCVASKNNIAKWLDLGEATVFRAIETLIAKGLIEKNELGHLRSLDLFNEQIANKHDWAIGFKGKESQYLSVGVNSDRGSIKMIEPFYQNDRTTSIKMIDNNNIYNNNNNNNIPPTSLKGDVEKVVELYEKYFDTKLLSLSDKRKKSIKARLATFSLEQIEQAIEYYANSPFHRGRNDRGWKADIDFVVRNDEQIEKALLQTKPKTESPSQSEKNYFDYISNLNKNAN